MTADERQLITGLFDRMRGFGAPEKDREAEALINQSVRANAGCALHAGAVGARAGAGAAGGQRAHRWSSRSRCAALEGEGQPPRQRGSGSFLGGLFGGGRRGRAAGDQRAGDRLARDAFPSGPARRPGWAATASPQAAPRSRWRRLHALGHGDGGWRRRRHAGGGCIRNMLGGGSTRARPGQAVRRHATAKPSTRTTADNDPGKPSRPVPGRRQRSGLRCRGGDDGIEI